MNPRSFLPLLLVAATTLGPLLPAPRDGRAAVICERTKKKRTTARLRAGACKKKEAAVFDTGANTNGLAEQDARVGRLEGQLGFACEGDPSRQLLTRSTLTRLGLLGYLSGTPSPCRTLDADPATCAKTFVPSAFGVDACVYLRGKCLPCDVWLAAARACTNPCQPPVTCADPARTDFVMDCEDLGNQAACERSWDLATRVALYGEQIAGFSCYWDAGMCKECVTGGLDGSGCTNACGGPPAVLRCRQAGRTLGDCDDHDGDAPACTVTYELNQYGTETCWYDGAKCHPCDPLDELAGRCTNPC